jgi:acetyl esterase/lipase
MTDGLPTHLWDRSAPGSESWTHEEQAGFSALSRMEAVRNVTVPTLTPYPPEDIADRAVVVCPGGAMHFLAIEHEGRSVAELLRGAGVAAFLLKYRVVPTPVDDEAYVQALADAFHSGMGTASASVLPLAVADAERAIELVRADGYRHVTLLGFSAGALVTSDVVLRSPAQRRLDAAAIC